MQKSIILVLLAFSLVGTSFVGANITTKQPNVILTPQTKTGVQFINDTGREVHIYIGSSRTLIGKNGVTYVSCADCAAGKKVFRQRNDIIQKGSLMLVLDASMCGKKIKLSQYL